DDGSASGEVPVRESFHSKLQDDSEKEKSRGLEMNLRLFEKDWRQPTLAESIKPLPSARLRLTAVFGMGTGRTTALWPPKKLCKRAAEVSAFVENYTQAHLGFQFAS